MNLETQLQIQAWLDGELPEAEARRLATLTERDPAAKALVAEFEAMRAALAGHEAGIKVPETREFYWSKIQRQIERIETAGSSRAEAESFGWAASWLRWLRPLAGTAMVAVAAIAMAWLVTPHGQGTDSFLAEVENLSDNVGSYSFRSPAQNMLVVWVYDKAPSPADESEIPDATTVQ